MFSMLEFNKLFAAALSIMSVTDGNYSSSHFLDLNLVTAHQPTNHPPEYAEQWPGLSRSKKIQRTEMLNIFGFLKR
ncbi:hypothetical protein PILCRDRAFT_226968 [Piloderma croceum F 1598]|uniref:Uncharacterized protein n=1 Tax=Piloderma croceum (strain F 1598) TaxID=765440 RepID=A0A0C3FYZ1_PILCF|nr:hypothetical protein PILCRDRAFT_226968 [Piloderma croceum F 1598]